MSNPPNDPTFPSLLDSAIAAAAKSTRRAAGHESSGADVAGIAGVADIATPAESFAAVTGLGGLAGAMLAAERGHDHAGAALPPTIAAEHLAAVRAATAACVAALTARERCYQDSHRSAAATRLRFAALCATTIDFRADSDHEIALAEYLEARDALEQKRAQLAEADATYDAAMRACADLIPWKDGEA